MISAAPGQIEALRTARVLRMGRGANQICPCIVGETVDVCI